MPLKTSTPNVDDDELSDDDFDDEPVAPFATQDASIVANEEQGITSDLNPIDPDERKSAAFFADPIKGMHIFLSSYMMKKGLCWLVPRSPFSSTLTSHQGPAQARRYTPPAALLRAISPPQRGASGVC
jgi:hypothetical protein